MLTSLASSNNVRTGSPFFCSRLCLILCFALCWPQYIFERSFSGSRRGVLAVLCDAEYIGSLLDRMSWLNTGLLSLKQIDVIVLLLCCADICLKANVNIRYNDSAPAFSSRCVSRAGVLLVPLQTLESAIRWLQRHISHAFAVKPTEFNRYSSVCQTPLF